MILGIQCDRPTVPTRWEMFSTILVLTTAVVHGQKQYCSVQPIATNHNSSSYMSMSLVIFTIIFQMLLSTGDHWAYDINYAVETGRALKPNSSNDGSLEHPCDLF